MRSFYHARTARIAIDVVALDQLAHQCGSIGQTFDESISINLAKVIDDFRGVEPKPGIDETGISARSTPSDLSSFEEHHVHSPLCKPESSDTAGISAADDRDLRTNLAFKTWKMHPRSGMGPYGLLEARIESHRGFLIHLLTDCTA